MDHKAIIEELGGLKGVASALGVRENVVSHWKARGIPPYYWNDIISIARRRDDALPLDIETLRAGRTMRVHRAGEVA